MNSKKITELRFQSGKKNKRSGMKSPINKNKLRQKWKKKIQVGVIYFDLASVKI